MPAGVELDELLKVHLLGDFAGAEGRGLGLQGGVQAVDVGLVVLGVVEGHDLLGDVRLEGLDRLDLVVVVDRGKGLTL